MVPGNWCLLPGARLVSDARLSWGSLARCGCPHCYVFRLLVPCRCAVPLARDAAESACGLFEVMDSVALVVLGSTLISSTFITLHRYLLGLFRLCTFYYPLLWENSGQLAENMRNIASAEPLYFKMSGMNVKPG